MQMILVSSVDLQNLQEVTVALDRAARMMGLEINQA